MPLLLHQNIIPKGELGLWRLNEVENYFLDKLDFEVDEIEEMKQLQKGRRLEWLAVRWLLHQMSGREVRGAVRKDEFGKPYLVDSPYQISMSHSSKMAAIIAAPFSVGIDIQKIVSKIERIAHKYMRTEEDNSLEPKTRLEHLHVYWGAKEALYKAYGRRALDFREHIHVKPFQYDVTNGKCLGYIIKDDFRAEYQIYYQKIEDYILVYALEMNESLS